MTTADKRMQTDENCDFKLNMHTPLCVSEGWVTTADKRMQTDENFGFELNMHMTLPLSVPVSA